MCGSSSTTRMVATASMLFGRLVLLRPRRWRLRLRLRPRGPAGPGIASGWNLRARLGRHAVATVPPAAAPAPWAPAPAGSEHEEQDEQQEEEGQEPEEPE